MDMIRMLKLGWRIDTMTDNDGTCPVCDQEIISDFDDPSEAMNWHIILKHPDRARKEGLIGD